jgi:nitrogen fixation protein NifQ
MDAPHTYACLIAGGAANCDPFDLHLLASILAMAAAGAESAPDHCTLASALGLQPAELSALMKSAFPQAAALFTPGSASPGVVTAEARLLPDDERCLRDLLLRSTTRRAPFQLTLATLIASRAMQPNHLWQDLGLRSRDELSELMQRHFAPLARRNTSHMKWKKFLYRMICRDEGFRLCTAPCCSECGDFAVCFGEESGESLLARNRRQADLQPHLHSIAAAAHPH